MPRLFSGLDLPMSVRSELNRLQTGLSGVKWVEPEDLHLTLRFVGDVDDHVADEFAFRLSQISFEAFDLTLDGVGAFGGNRPHSIYAAVAPGDGLSALQHDHEMAAKASGLDPEGRKFTPHVTLGRMRRSKVDFVARYLEQTGAFMSSSFEIDSFCLFSARESRGGGPYVVEQRVFAQGFETGDDDGE